MDEELEQELVQSYPDIFELYELYSEEIDGPVPQMVLFGFECGDGWFNIIDGLCELIQNQGVELTAVQVKEKYGGLRFYHNGIQADEERRAYMVMGAIQHAQQMSFRTCENCGSAGELRTDSWYKTRCDECYSAEESE